MREPLDHSSTHRISFDIAGHRHKVIIIDYAKALEAPLPEMPAGAIMAMIAPDMRRHEPLHTPAEVISFLCLQQQVKIIRHQAIGVYIHAKLHLHLPKQQKKRLVVAIPLEDPLLPVASIEYVIYA